MWFPLFVLLAVFALIVARRVGRLRVAIWQAMTAGAVLVLVSGSIAPAQAWAAIDWHVIVFLTGMFLLGQALLDSGYLARVADHLFMRARTVGQLVGWVIGAVGLASAILMNDTLALVVTPLLIAIARRQSVPALPLLLTAAFAVTIGSTMSPIGNPQNLLIALRGGIEAPFVTFAYYLALPTLVNLMLTYYVLRAFYPGLFARPLVVDIPEPDEDEALAALAKWGLGLVVLIIAVKVLLVAVSNPVNIELSAIAICGALPIVLFSKRRWEMVRKIDWRTLLFFVSMFVLMASVWQTGFFQQQVVASGLPLATLPSVMAVSVTLSQLISNVPLVALYMPMLQSAGGGTDLMMALAAGSTIAGNLLILGAASNVIIIQGAERYGEAIGFWQFARVGAPLTAINVAVYLGYFWLIGSI